MARSKTLRSRLGTVIFVLFIAATGVALVATDHMHNPFEVVPRVLGMEDEAGLRGDGDFRGGNEGLRGQRPDGDFRPSEGQRPEPPAGDFRGERGGDRDGDHEGGENGTGIQWNQLGDVLYNLWVIGAAAAVVMVVGTPTGRLIKRLRRAKKPTVVIAPVSEAVENPTADGDGTGSASA